MPKDTKQIITKSAFLLDVAPGLIPLSSNRDTVGQHAAFCNVYAVLWEGILSPTAYIPAFPQERTGSVSEQIKCIRSLAVRHNSTDALQVIYVYSACPSLYVTLWFDIHYYYAMHSSVMGVNEEVHSIQVFLTAGERVTCSHAWTGPLMNVGLEDEFSTANLSFVLWLRSLEWDMLLGACVQKAEQIVKVL